MPATAEAQAEATKATQVPRAKAKDDRAYFSRKPARAIRQGAEHAGSGSVRITGVAKEIGLSRHTVF